MQGKIWSVEVTYLIIISQKGNASAPFVSEDFCTEIKTQEVSVIDKKLTKELHHPFFFFFFFF